jgi:hypothetical protein
MAQQDFQPSRRRVSLSVKVSLALVGAAIFPLLLTLGFSELQTRPQLITQANNAMEGDAHTRVQLIDTYFHERLLDTQTITQIPSIQLFVATPPSATATYQSLATHADYGLVAGTFRDSNYTVWSLFNPKGLLLLSYPTDPKPHGHYLVPPQYLHAVDSGKNFVSAVYYSQATNKASVDIYAPIFATQVPGAPHQKPVFLGFTRATLNLNYVWNIVNDDHDNGTGSYAFILDENGVRIAVPQNMRNQLLMQSVAPVAPAAQQQINLEARFGSSSGTVPVFADNSLTNLSSSSSNDFQAQPSGQNEAFQIVHYPTDTAIIPWHYFVLSPVNTVTSVANQQLLVTAIIAAAMSALVALLGIIVGRNITHPILLSVENLRNNSRALSSLAALQRDAASEQMWVVDSSQVGLQSVQYYTDATQVAAQRLTEAGIGLIQNWQHAEPVMIHKALEHVIIGSRYIEEATHHQTVSNQKLSTALKVANQVTEQLATGATSATDAATQMEMVVQQLRSVVGD